MNFLTRIARAVMGPPAKAPKNGLPVPTAVTDAELRGLEEKWQAAPYPYMQVKDFLKAYKAYTKAYPDPATGQRGSVRNALFEPEGQYSITRSNIEGLMSDGKAPFFYPRPGIYNYPEADMFYIEHCYIHVRALVAEAWSIQQSGGDYRARLFISALKESAISAELKTADTLERNGYLHEDGSTATTKFYRAAVEMGEISGPVLRLRQNNSSRRLSGPKPQARLSF